MSYDSIKWQFSQYSHGGKYYEDIHKVMHSILGVVCELKYNVITEALHKISRQKLIDIATSHGYEILEINLEADYEILSKRFEEFFDIYQREKNPSAITFITDTPNMEEVSENVMKLL